MENSRLKFRAWAKYSEMLPNIQNHIGNDKWAFGNMLKSDEFVVMQYTGLKDKKGKDIYHNDILKADKLDSNSKDWVGVIDYNNYGGLCLFYKCYLNDGIMRSYQEPINDPQTAEWVINNCEVIGNIYENPELLKDNKC